MRALAEAKRQTLEIDLPSSLPHVAVDAHRVSQVLSNLVGPEYIFFARMTLQMSGMLVSCRNDKNAISFLLKYGSHPVKKSISLVRQDKCQPCENWLKRNMTVGAMNNKEASGSSRKRVSAELDAMIRLHKLSTLSVTEGDLGIILCETVDTAIAVTGADFGTIQFVDPVSSALRIVAQRGFPQWWVDFWNNVPVGQGSCGVSLERRGRVIVENVEQSPIFAVAALEMQLKAGVRAVQSTPLISRSGKPLGMFSTHYRKPQRPDEGTLRILDLLARQAADVIEHVQTIATMRESGERYRLAISGSPVVVWECDRDLRYTFMDNPQPPVTDPAQFIGKRDEEILPFDSVRELIEIKNRVLATGVGERREISLPAADKMFHFEMVVEPIYNSDRMIAGLRGLAIDISERKRTEETLRSVSAELRQTLHVAATGLTHCSRDLRYLSANPAYAQWVGLPLEQIVGRPIVEVMGKAAFEIIRPRIERVLRGETVEYEDEVPIGGVRKWIRVAYTPDRDPSGDVVGWVASVMDITERKRMEEERAEEGRRKDEFLSLLSHELRNPLAAISTAVQLLSGSVTDEKRVSLNRMMDRQVKLMQRLLDDLLDLSRITHGYIQLKEERIDLAKLLQHATEVTQSTAVERGQEMILRLPSEVVTFKGDEARLEQIAINLLTNASKYTAHGGRIELSGVREGSEVVLRCKDNGRGIPREMQQKIFEPFTRVEPFSDSRGEASLGIGLALVKRLVELHGGTISVESAGPGMGTEFTVRLPLESAPSDQLVVPETRPVSSTRHSRLIVVVEDNFDVAGTMLAALERAGYRVALFADAFSALAEASDLRPHAVLLDIGLPGMDGYKLAAKLREKQNLRHTLLIGLSGFKRRAATGSRDNFDYYFNKPVDLPALFSLLDTPAQPGAAEAATARQVLEKVEPFRVLLIDDHADLSAATAALLRSEGLEVRSALSGREGLEVAPDFKPQLTLCDLNLPDMRGQEVIHLLRSNPLTRHTYAVVLTALSKAEVREYNREAERMGINEFIPKPLMTETVRTLVTKVKRKQFV